MIIIRNSDGRAISGALPAFKGRCMLAGRTSSAVMASCASLTLAQCADLGHIVIVDLDWKFMT